MPTSSRLPSISPEEFQRRRTRIVALAEHFKFAGRIEYLHEPTESGGAQYRPGRTPAEDTLVVYAEAFRREADPQDFSLEAILAHERGHQIVRRHPRLHRFMKAGLSVAAEETLASLIGSLLVDDAKDVDALLLKAVAEAVQWGIGRDRAFAFVVELRDTLGAIL